MHGLNQRISEAENNTPPGFLPESFYLFIRDGSLHRYIGQRFCARTWCLPAAFLYISVFALLRLTPYLVCARVIHLATRRNTLTEIGSLMWYRLCLQFVFLYLLTMELTFFWALRCFKELGHPDGTYPFPVLYICLRAVGHWTLRLWRDFGSWTTLAPSAKTW